MKRKTSTRKIAVAMGPPEAWSVEIRPTRVPGANARFRYPRSRRVIRIEGEREVTAHELAVENGPFRTHIVTQLNAPCPSRC